MAASHSLGSGPSRVENTFPDLSVTTSEAPDTPETDGNLVLLSGSIVHGCIHTDTGHFTDKWFCATPSGPRVRLRTGEDRSSVTPTTDILCRGTYNDTKDPIDLRCSNGHTSRPRTPGGGFGLTGRVWSPKAHLCGTPRGSKRHVLSLPLHLFLIFLSEL